MMKYKCPCCGNNTYDKPAYNAHGFICDVCYWENDLLAKSDNDPSFSNHGLTLTQARKNYLKIGACTKSMLKYVRKPLPDEIIKA